MLPRSASRRNERSPRAALPLVSFQLAFEPSQLTDPSHPMDPHGCLTESGARASRLQRLQPSLATSSAEALLRRQFSGSASVTPRMLRQMRFRSPSASPSVCRRCGQCRRREPVAALPDFELFGPKRLKTENNNNDLAEGTATYSYVARREFPRLTPNI